MSRGKRSQGQCLYCSQEMAGSGMVKHLSACQERQKKIADAEQNNAAKQKLYHLRVQDAWEGTYWLDLEMSGRATLKKLDDYLRAIWLECCGHLSRFSIDGWRGQEIPMRIRADQIFELDEILTHIYDFGTSSETLIKVVAVREGASTTKHPIALMARNLQPSAECMECGKSAAWLCIECVYEDNASGFLCDAHVKKHPHNNYGEPFPIVNSPRLGMCGYTGPADPPY
jgi:hypothetical protein